MKKQLATLLLGLFVLASPSRAQDDFKLEPGFTSLFNGKDLTGWYYKSKEKDDLAGKTETLDKRFTVEGGAIVANVGKGIRDLYTTQNFGTDFVVKMEFRASPKSDSGVYIRGPQLQVRDFIRRGEQKHLKGFKNDDWNELAITVEGTIATFTCNGEPLKNPDKMSIPKKGGIGLQAEDGKFEFRRIRIQVAAAKPRFDESLGNPAKDAGDRIAQRPGPGTPKKRLLLITESKGFPHQVSARQYTILTKDADLSRFPKTEGLDVTLTKDKKIRVIYHGRLDKPLEIKDKDEVLAVVKPCLVETTFMDLAKKTGLFDVDCSQNSRVEITGENLKKYDAVFFYTTGELPLTDAQKSDLLAFVRKDGKGFGGSHCATDTFYQWKEYGDLIGAYFDGHPWTQKIHVIVEDKNHAATKHLGNSFFIDDEIYQFRGPFSREKLHVLMKLDMDSVRNQGKRADKDNAIAWTHEYGKGRVFYTALGHRPEVWNDARFQQHVVGGLRYLFGLEK